MRGVGGLVLDNVLHLEPGFVFVKTLEKNEFANVATISKEVWTGSKGPPGGRLVDGDLFFCHSADQ